MRPIYLSVALLSLGLAGCKSCCREEGACHEGIVIKTPAPKVILEQPTAAPAPVAAAPPPPAPVAAPAPVATSAPMVPMAYSAAPVGMPMGAPAPVSVRERTGLGLTLDSFTISIPCLKLISVPRPTEVTYHVPPPPVAPVGYAPPMMPMAMPMAMPYAAPPPMTYQPCAPPPAPVAAAPPPAAPAPCPPVTEQQCDEIIEKCNILKRLHQLKQHALDAA